jgi:hypothetical protein
LELVVEDDLLAGHDGSHAEESDAQFTVDRPLLGLGVWVARVVDESRHVAFQGGIDDAVGAERHEVVML